MTAAERWDEEQTTELATEVVRRNATLRVAAGLLWAVVVLGLVRHYGAKPGWPVIAVGAWITTVVWRIDLPPRIHLEFLRDWWLPVAVLAAYTYSRGLADNLGRPVVEHWPIAVDRWLGGGELPGRRLQEVLCSPHCTLSSRGTPLDSLLTLTYYSHFVVAWALAVVLWLRGVRTTWAAWMRRLLTLDVCALVVYVLVPMRPPWMASDRGAISPPLPRLTGLGWSGLGDQLSTALTGRFVNTVAAMPSLHTATATLVALFAMSRVRRRIRWLLLLYPLLMATALVYFGEHYLIDVLAGFALALAVAAGWTRWERSRRRLQPTPQYVDGH